MRPNAIPIDLPSTHDVSKFIQNSFVKLLGDLKARVKVYIILSPGYSYSNCLLSQASQTGRVSITTDLWSVQQTKASFMGVTAHWIKSNSSWTLCSEVIAFRAVSGPHTGSNLGRYIVSLCERVGIIDHTDTKVCFFFFFFSLCCLIFHSFSV